MPGPASAAKKHALKAVGTIRDAKMDVIEMNFQNSVGASSLARTVGIKKFSGDLGGVGRRPRVAARAA